MLSVFQLEQDIKDKEQQEELGEKYLEEATQDYNYENPGTVLGNYSSCQF